MYYALSIHIVNVFSSLDKIDKWLGQILTETSSYAYTTPRAADAAKNTASLIGKGSSRMSILHKAKVPVPANKHIGLPSDIQDWGDGVGCELGDGTRRHRGREGLGRSDRPARIAIGVACQRILRVHTIAKGAGNKRMICVPPHP